MDLAVHAFLAAVRALFSLRASLGRLFGWDDPGHAAISRSYVGRLSEADRSRSLETPGVQRGVWRVVYTFEDEALREVINRTVHAFVLFALRPATDGYTLYWGIYVRPVGKLTAVYMALIDPFRRWLVYPDMIRRMENAWLCSLSSCRALRVEGLRSDRELADPRSR